MKPPPRPVDDPRNAPVTLRRELLAQGYDDYAIRRFLADGVLVRVRRGAFVAKAAYDALDEAGRHGLGARAVLKQAKTDVVLSHLSGLPEYDAPTWGVDLTDVHVTRVDGRIGRHEAGVHQHCRRILDGDVVMLNGVRVMSATRVALEVTTVLDVEPALCVVNHLLHAGWTTEKALEARYRTMDNWPNTLTTDIVLRLADARVASVAESRCFHLFWRGGLPAPVPQFEIRDENGDLIAQLDFAWPELGVWLEFDGKVKYEKPWKSGLSASDVVIAEKKREDLIRRRTGWRCIRLTWADLERPGATVEMIRRQLFRAA